MFIFKNNNMISEKFLTSPPLAWTDVSDQKLKVISNHLLMYQFFAVINNESNQGYKFKFKSSEQLDIGGFPSKL